MANAAETYNCDGDTNPHLSLHFSSFSDGRLKNFIAGTKFPPRFTDTVTSEEDEEGVELSLGLSLNGRFGLDPTRDKNLARSSSIPDLLKPSSKDEGTSVSVTWTPILRTSSLPMEVQEECRKRKQMQSLRRMEAKRKRTEKQRNKTEDHYHHHIGNQPNTENDNVFLVASQGSGSSGISSDFDTPQSIQANEYAEEGRPQLDKHKPKPKPNQTLNGVATDMRKVLLEMPCVSTTGEGPNGRRIEGFLYRYSKGEEVKIVCVCHGSFLSPAEFVEHAGGAHVLHPLKHIVVTPSPFP